MRIAFENYWKVQRNGSFILPLLCFTTGNSKMELIILGFGIEIWIV